MDKMKLIGNYSVQEVSAEAWHEVFTEHMVEVFPDEQSSPLDFLLNEAEAAKLNGLRNNLSQTVQLYFLILDGETPIGWHYGFQRSDLEYFMANTGILPAYRNQGIYSAFLKYIINRAVEAGFQFITSIHNATNNAVLIPKLKAGFLIQSFGFLIQTMILESNYGPMIQLVYPAKDAYRRMFEPLIGNRAVHQEFGQLGKTQLPEK